MTVGLIALFMPVSILDWKKFASTESLIEITNSVYVVLYSESLVFQFAIQTVKDQDIQDYNIARCSVWVWNLVADIEGET
jgi:hypothetical protein